jgi:hypothetical protein
VLNRRDFCRSILAVPVIRSGIRFAARPTPSKVPASGSGFPLSDYTPYGYLDNPFHCWNLHRSGVLRSSPGIGFGFYYPAGPGGYFDFAKNGVYEAHLRLGFLINGRQYWKPEDFAPGQLTPPTTAKPANLAFTLDDTKVDSTFLQVGENSLATKVVVRGTRPQLCD